LLATPDRPPADVLRAHGVELQIGGSDQWGNLLAGVDLIRRADGGHVHAFTWPLVLRSDGKKFGKSEDGAVFLAADRTSPYQFFQYWMNVADADIERFAGFLAREVSPLVSADG